MTVIEEWRTCLGFPSYEISDLGRIRRVVKQTSKKFNRTLKCRVGTAGYRYCSLSELGKTYTKYVHHLVAETFVGPRPTNYDVSHENDDKLDNRACNLKYRTQADNTRRAYENGLIAVARGETHTYAKLTEVKVREIRKRFAEGESGNKLAGVFGVTSGAIGAIIRRKAWKHVI
jgi:hypothetical protein